MANSNKQFVEANDTAVFTTKFVVLDNKDITIVNHHKEDGAWEFFSNDHFENFYEVAMVVGLEQMIKRDDTILDVADLPVGYTAHRKFKGDKWIIEENTIDAPKL